MNLTKTEFNLEEAINLYNQGYGTSYIAKVYKCSTNKVVCHFKKNNVQIRKLSEYILNPARKKYYLDDTFFDKIDSQEKAYILGFLYADGYNNTKRGVLVLTLQQRDEHILEDIKKHFTNVPVKRYEHKSSYNSNKSFKKASLYIHSRKISDRLNELGCGNNKSFVLEFPNYLSFELIPHFIRGYLDGDGCICLPKNGAVKVSLLSSLSFIEEFIKVVYKYIGIQFVGTTHAKSKNIGEAYCCNRNRCLKFLDWIYKDSTIHLHRKYNKYLKLQARGTSCNGPGNKGLANQNLMCLNCQSFSITKHGLLNGNQKYKCNSCQKICFISGIDIQ